MEGKTPTNEQTKPQIDFLIIKRNLSNCTRLPKSQAEVLILVMSERQVAYKIVKKMEGRVYMQSKYNLPVAVKL